MNLLQTYDVLLLDLDGVVYRGVGAVPHAVEVLRSAADGGTRLGFVTNNASRPPQQVADHLQSLGVACTPQQVVTSAQVGADLLATKVSGGSRILAIGGPGVALALAERGFEPVDAMSERARGRDDAEIAGSVAGVLQGFGPDVRWRDLAVASYAVAGGAAWVATNTDRTIPRADGIAPGNGTLVAAVSEATGVVPPSAGKPAADMMRIAAERLGAVRPLVVGDRLDTDIRGAGAAGLDSLLVLTGVSGLADLLAAEPQDRPTYVAADLRALQDSPARLDTAAPNDPVAQAVRACWSDEAVDRVRAVERLRALLGA